MKLLNTILILMVLGITQVKAQMNIEFELSFTEPQAHYVDVKMKITGLSQSYVDLVMPVWQPGSYLIREFSKNVERFQAKTPQGPADFNKIKKNIWRIQTDNQKALEVIYRVYAFEVSVRTSFVDDSRAFLSPTGIFMYPEGYLHNASTVKVIPFKNWNRVTTGLPSADAAFTYIAKDFDILFDSPIEVGTQDVFSFNASGVKHDVAMVSGGNYNPEVLKKDMAKIVDYQTSIFGVNPNSYYTFIVHNYESGRGGLEHLNSTVLGATRNGYTNPSIYYSYLRLVAHEYFHLWNIKRMRPVELGPFNYSEENYTTNLWISEGFTTYYSSKSLAKTGFNTDLEFANIMAASVAGIENTIGAKYQSAAQSSFDTWIVHYRPNENSPNSSVSYYSKGEVIGALMDLAIIHATKGAKSLDDVMKAMYEKGEAEGKGFTETAFKHMVEKIAGIDFTEFWKKYVYGTDALEYDKYFGYAGLKVVNENAGKYDLWLGTGNTSDRGVVTITSVARGSAAWNDGLNVNDIVLAADGKAVEGNLEEVIKLMGKKAGDQIVFSIKRNGLLRDIPVTLTNRSLLKLKVSVDPNATAMQKAVFRKWAGE